MNVEVFTSEDLLKLKKDIVKAIRSEAERNFIREVKLLSSDDIIEILGISKDTFERIIPKLTKYGMFKHGRLWRMQLKDFNMYIESHKAIPEEYLVRKRGLSVHV